MADKGFFEFKTAPSYAPSYRFNGGTKAVSEMSGQGIEDMLRYVHNHATVIIEKKKDCTKSKEEALKCFEKAKCFGGLQALKELNKTLIHLPKDESEITEKAKAMIKDISIEYEVKSYLSDETSKSEASNKLKIAYKEGVGRHVIASEDISVGETIVREKPFVSFLHHSHQRSNCLNCLIAVVHGIRCENCSQVVFCSESCQESAKLFHNCECGFTEIIPGLGPLAPVLRIFTSKSVQFFTERIGKFDDYDKSVGDFASDSDVFEDMFNLQAGNKTSSQYKIDKAAYTYFLICILKKMSYFGNNKDEAFDIEHVVIGKFINHFLKIADDNCHEVCELDVPKSAESKSFDELFGSEDTAIRVVGVAIYPKISLFNNSCDVNTFKYHQANQEIMVARRDIKAGEEVNDFYGEYFFQNSKLSRKKNLGFPCGCIPCKEDWALLDDLPNFTFEEVEARYDWAVERVALESALAHMDVPCIKKICEHLGQIVNVEGPHQVKVQPELYLSYAYMFLYCNKSIGFMEFYNKIMKNAGKEMT